MGMAAIILACLLPISCGHNSRQSVGGESEELEEVEVEESGSKGGLMPVPVYHSSKSGPDKYSNNNSHLCIALMNPNTGELVQFDNDEDYSGYCAFCRFVLNYCDIPGWRYKEVFGADIDELAPDHNVSDTVYNYHCSFINGFIDYINGNKDKIKDRKLFKKIDKAFYDSHPDQEYFVPSTSGYGYKYYRSNRERSQKVQSTDYDNEYRSYFFHDGTELPEGTLVFTHY